MGKHHAPRHYGPPAMFAGVAAFVLAVGYANVAPAQGGRADTPTPAPAPIEWSRLPLTLVPAVGGQHEESPAASPRLVSPSAPRSRPVPVSGRDLAPSWLKQRPSPSLAPSATPPPPTISTPALADPSEAPTPCAGADDDQ